MSEDDGPAMLVLHGLRLSGFATADHIANRWALDVPTVELTLARCRDDGLVVHREGRLTGWMLSAAGRSTGERMLAAELDRAGARGIAEAGYGAFQPLNAEFLALCTDWQLRVLDGEQVLNDHQDPEHDSAVIARLEDLHPRVSAILDELSAPVPRFAQYDARLSFALGRVRANDVDWLTKPVIDSYHTVWFELHEDLLATLGRDRATETQADHRESNRNVSDRGGRG
ncbi:MAG TPA: hypothetical protein VJM33_07965 [Microthrixaceae bacterium]|nr:hypothetical protein [Microthrixaceae bacterium]